MNATAPTTFRFAERAAQVNPYAIATTAVMPRLKLDTNECPPLLTPSELADACASDINRYPDSRSLRNAIASALNIESDRVAVTAGADDAIDRICRVFLESGRDMIVTTPTFDMIPRSGRSAGASINAVSWCDSAFPLDAVLKAVTPETGLIAVVSPNNPTGEILSPTDLIGLATSAPNIPILLDLAYIEFAETDLTPLALSLPNVIITRTFSKAYGLAGFRIGFAAGSANAIAAVRAIGGPYPVTTPAINAAALALKLADSRLPSRIATIARERELLTRVLRSCGAQVIDSQANFVFARCDVSLSRRLAEACISVRTFGLDDNTVTLRITCPCNERDIQTLINALTTEEVIQS